MAWDAKRPQPDFCLRHHPAGAPRNAGEHFGDEAATCDEIVAAVSGGTENHLGPGEQAESIKNPFAAQPGRIGPEHHNAFDARAEETPQGDDELPPQVATRL